jgi:hypothetical protein
VSHRTDIPTEVMATSTICNQNFVRICSLAVNPLPHGVLATFYLTAGGPIKPPKKGDIGREKTILMTSVRTQRASAVRREGLYYIYPPQVMKRSLCTVPCTMPGTIVFIPRLAVDFLRMKRHYKETLTTKLL